MDICIVVPVYNEGIRAIKTVKKILEITKCKIVIIDDGSNDNTYELLKKRFKLISQIEILKNNVNRGKGYSMKRGVKRAWELGKDAVIFIDADYQHNPDYLPMFIDELKNSSLVFGYRELKEDAPWVRKTGNIIVGWLIEVLFNIKRKDTLCGFWGFRKNIYKKIKWRSDRYEIETEVSSKVGRNKLSFSEIKIDTIYIDKYKGVTIFDAMKILFKIPYWYFSK